MYTSELIRILQDDLARKGDAKVIGSIIVENDKVVIGEGRIQNKIKLASIPATEDVERILILEL